MQRKKLDSRRAGIDNNGYLITAPEFKRSNNNVQLLRIIITSIETKIDFGYQATSYYIRGGWIKISPKTFIRPCGSNKKLILENATNIPFGPEKLHFNSSIEWRYFSLHFPSLLSQGSNDNFKGNFYFPFSAQEIDLIEQENGTPNDFNFYGIRLDDRNKISLIY